MTAVEVICPECGASVPQARRCRKCAAPLPDLPDDALAAPEERREGFEVELVSTRLPDSEQLAGQPVRRRYHLEVTDLSGQAPPKSIPVRGTSGMSLHRWRVTRRGGRSILSAYFYINSAGHDLDTWIHYDLETGRELALQRGDENDPDPAARLDLEG